MIALFVQYIAPKPGVFVDIDTGQIVGSHNGEKIFLQ